MALFEIRAEAFEQTAIALYGCCKTVSFLCLDLIWRKYAGWLRTVTSTIPSEEVVRSVIQQEYYHNFGPFRNTAIYRIIMSKSKQQAADLLPLAA